MEEFNEAPDIAEAENPSEEIHEEASGSGVWGIHKISSSKEGIHDLTFKSFEEAEAWFNQRGFFIVTPLHKNGNRYAEAMIVFPDGGVKYHIVSIISDTPLIDDGGVLKKRRGRPPKVKGEKELVADGDLSSSDLSQEKGGMERTLTTSETLAEPETLKEEKIETVEAPGASEENPGASTCHKQETENNGTETKEKAKAKGKKDKQTHDKEPRQTDWLEDLLK